MEIITEIRREQQIRVWNNKSGSRVYGPETVNVREIGSRCKKHWGVIKKLDIILPSSGGKSTV